MKIIDDWQYRYIEKSLYNYDQLCNSKLETERRLATAIKQAISFFSGTSYEIMITEFYFNLQKQRKSLTRRGYYRKVCREMLFIEESNGYVIRREIIYRIAMNCYSLGVFKLNT